MSAPTLVRIADVTRPDVRARLDAGWTTIILPLGATEQHGRHLPLSVDTEIRESTAELGGRYFEAIVAAMVSYVSSGAATAAEAGRTA